ncbi:MAG: hypothetical protein U9M89_00480 [Patescibacteria group bacterium]|nr:hypothetical protein [Patescibacteria group bacterium]
MAKKSTPKKIKTNPPIFQIVVVLLLSAGITYFIYADGTSFITNAWFGFTTPNTRLEIDPKTSFLPADNLSQATINIKLLDGDTLLDGDNIVLAILEGQTNLTKSDPPPANLSKQIFVRAPETPQTIELKISYLHLFEIVRIETYDPTPPQSPKITAPTNGTLLSTATPVISGEGHKNGQVEIYTDGSLNTIIDIGDKVQFSAKLAKPLRNGKHTISSKSITSYGAISNLSETINIEVQTPDPEIDLDNLKITPNPVKSLASFWIFVPASSQITSIDLTLDGTKTTLQDSNQSSIFSGVIQAPKNPGIYRISLDLGTANGESVFAEKVASVEVN